MHLKIEQLGYRKRIMKELYFLKVLWIKLSGGLDAHGLNLTDKSSIMCESQDLMDQSSFNI